MSAGLISFIISYLKKAQLDSCIVWLKSTKYLVGGFIYPLTDNALDSGVGLVSFDINTYLNCSFKMFA